MERGWDIYQIYCDEDYSGADALRPDFNRMLEAAKAGRFQVVLCKSQSRFTRDRELQRTDTRPAKKFKKWRNCSICCDLLHLDKLGGGRKIETLVSRIPAGKSCPVTALLV